MNARPDSAHAPATAPFPAEFRSALEFAQAAVWDWHGIGRPLPGRRGLAARIRHRRRTAARCRVRSGSGASIPTISARSSRPADSCHHGGDRFECEYRLLAAGHRWLWVLHRGRVVQRDRDGSAARITGLLLDIDRRKSEEVARSDSESRLATALWGARAAFWQWHVPSNARTASPLWLAMTGYSRAQWDATPNPWFSNLHPDDRERVDRQLQRARAGRCATRSSSNIAFRPRAANSAGCRIAAARSSGTCRAGRCWSSASRSTSTPPSMPKRTCAPASPCSKPRPGARASGCGKPISSPTRRAGSTTGATATTSIPATATDHVDRWDS